MEFKDYYKTLGVERGAEQKAVSTAFRKLARKYHPDINRTKGAEDKFKEINEAYQVLGDPEKRAKYDQMHEAYQRGGVNWQDMFGRTDAWQSQSPGGWTVTMEGNPADLEDLLGGLGGFSDFFRQFFGTDVIGSQRPRGRARGRARTAVEDPFGRTAAPPQASAAAPLEVTLEEAHRGAQKPVALQVNGTTRRLDVTIPKGVRSGQRIRLPGALDGGDLYLTIQIAPHPRFERRDDDLVVEVPVSLTEALLGGKIEVPTLEGTVEMTIPPETQNGQLFRLRGQGMSRRDGTRGDLIVRVHVVLPKNLTKRERELAEELGKLRRENPRT
ncbi:MAG TPA: DnaJ C-terminal domain-containing protein [bacterium]|nr:DnaJ C-terminal domain-containing protein [bacterium]